MAKASCTYKAKKGVIRVIANVDRDSSKLKDIRIFGDFMIYPEDSIMEIEEKLSGLDLSEIDSALREFFNSKDIIFIGSSVEDFVRTIKCAIEKTLEG